MNYHLCAFAGKSGTLSPLNTMFIILHFANPFYKNYTAFINTSPQKSKYAYS